MHIDETIEGVEGKQFDNALFYNCTFDKLNGVALKNCVLDKSTFVAGNIEDLLGFTVTLDCHSFSDVELSPTIFDLILILLMKTRGNVEKRKQILDLLGKDRVRELLTAMASLEHSCTQR